MWDSDQFDHSLIQVSGVEHSATWIERSTAASQIRSMEGVGSVLWIKLLLAAGALLIC